MQVKNELRKRQKAITGDLKARSQKAEKILGEIEACETKLSSLNESLSAVLLMDVMQAAVAANGEVADWCRRPHSAIDNLLLSVYMLYDNMRSTHSRQELISNPVEIRVESVSSRCIKPASNRQLLKDTHGQRILEKR